MAKRRKAKDTTGHRARTPLQMPAPAWRAIAARTWKRTWQDNVGLVAAGVTYYGFLAIVPLLGIIVLTYGLIADPATVVSNVRTITVMLPPDVATLVADQLIAAVEAAKQTKGVGILIALLVALYGGTNGASAIITALNIAYEEKEKRSLGGFYLLATIMTAAAVVLAVFALVATTALAFLGSLAPNTSPLTVALARIGGFVLMTLSAAAIAATLYRYAPSREHARWTWITPGSLFAAIAWLLLTLGFSFYVTSITDYNVTYGSLGTIVVLLTWLYLSAYVLIFGAELNSEIEHQSSRDTTTGAPRPLGKRGAWAADNVATSGEPDRHAAPSMAEAMPEPPTVDMLPGVGPAKPKRAAPTPRKPAPRRTPARKGKKT
ncbi:YhjD/YihY/BrkB family envelope integrity protein [Sphingomonas sabuli]|uniref:YhjD/YihY/BrkB family envelope integrity protein n=1 Tax=Sphingomonas sabuli TaxID=2764186 RepID=UPI001CA466B5|nr:YhjD/YihY/BrkB family envelope integrity protein [Sphingomonas sabuli]